MSDAGQLEHPYEQAVISETHEIPVGVADLFKIGIGPSSSHTSGPMLAAARFVSGLHPDVRTDVVRIVARAFGSLAWTGKGHGTEKALVLGLAGFTPDVVDPAEAVTFFDAVESRCRLAVPGVGSIDFIPARDIMFDRSRTFARHSNAMEFECIGADGNCLAREVWFSIGGGFIEREGAEPARRPAVSPWGYTTAKELLSLARSTGLSVPTIAMANETLRRPERDTKALLDQIFETMMACIDRGVSTRGELPGGLGVKRRAADLYERLEKRRLANAKSPNEPFDCVSAFAIAVNEENAAGGRVVTAPTNGAAGVIPAVLRYYRDFCGGASGEGIRTFLLAATAIGGIIKRNASISGAEVGCQGEVGSASAMAAAGLAAALGATAPQIENAAEIAMEHHLGMTCDPIGGLVQIPCIERNAFGAVKAINATSLAMHGDGTHVVSLDQAIATMRQTGADMNEKYRETSRGGLAVNVPEC